MQAASGFTNMKDLFDTSYGTLSSLAAFGVMLRTLRGRLLLLSFSFPLKLLFICFCGM
jgi:hypothetical protein